MSTCVFCNNTAGLNTKFVLSLEDGSKAEVQICDLHAEEATVKTAKEAYLNKQRQIETLIAQAKAFGLEIGESKGGISVATRTAPPPPAQPRLPEPGAEISPNDPDVIPTSMVDNKRMQSVGGDIQGHNIPGLASHDLSSLRNRLGTMADGHVKLAMVEGRGGRMIAVPQKRVDGMGVTRINVTKGIGDHELQQRFKGMAQGTMREDGAASFPQFSQGYESSQRVCPLCHGDTEVINGREKTICPKCKGLGSISTI